MRFVSAAACDGSICACSAITDTTTTAAAASSYPSSGKPPLRSISASTARSRAHLDLTCKASKAGGGKAQGETRVGQDVVYQRIANLASKPSAIDERIV